MGSVRWGCRVIALVFGFALACGYEVHDDHSSDGCLVGSAGCPCAEDGGCDGASECVEGSCQPGLGASTTSGATSGATSSATTAESTSASESTSTDTATSGASACTNDSVTSADATTGPCEFICDDAPGDELGCDVFAQDCCEGQKCAAYDMDGDGAWDISRCVDIMGDGQHGEPCTANPIAEGGDDCGLGVMCWYLDEDGAGKCVELCTETPENPSCAPPNSYCYIIGGSALNLCIDWCDPLLQSCSQDQVCIPDSNSEGFVCVPDASDGAAPEGAPCEFFNVCDPGMMCVDPDFYPAPGCQGSLGCCAPFCDLENGDADCESLSVDDAVCVPYYDPGTAPEWLENVGGCGVTP